MRQRLFSRALIMVATIAAAAGLAIFSPATSSATQAQTVAASPNTVLGRWVIYDIYPSESECKSAKAFIDSVTNLATLPVGNSCYVGEFGYYFLFWDA